MSEILLWLVTIVLLLAGLVGTVVPGLPGIAFVFAGIFLFAVVTDFTVISGTTLLAISIIAVIATVADYLGSALGSRAAGGGKLAVAGAIIGSLVGIIAGPPGIFIGAFAGALLGAVYEGATGEKAIRVAVYSMIGVLGAMIVQFALALVMIITFLVAVFM